MILDSLDIIAIESNIEIADYVRESAQFEIDRGNTKYIAIFEEADATVEKRNESWLVKIVEKVKSFCRACANNIHAAIRRVGIIRKRVKIDKAISKVRNLNKFGVIRGKDLEKIITDLQTYHKYIDCDGDDFATKTKRIVGKTTLYIYDTDIPKTQKEFDEKYIKVSTAKLNIDSYDFVELEDDLDYVGDILNAFLSAMNGINALYRHLKSDGLSSAEIHRGVSTMLRYMTNSVNTVYKSIINVSKTFFAYASHIDDVDEYIYNKYDKYAYSESEEEEDE